MWHLFFLCTLVEKIHRCHRHQHRIYHGKKITRGTLCCFFSFYIIIRTCQIECSMYSCLVRKLFKTYSIISSTGRRPAELLGQFAVRRPAICQSALRKQILWSISYGHLLFVGLKSYWGLTHIKESGFEFSTRTLAKCE